jgi:hypothetical protein
MDKTRPDEIKRLKKEVARLCEKHAQLRDACRLAYEWAAAYPLEGEGTTADYGAADKVYQACAQALGE